MATTVDIPLQPDSTDTTNANAFWTAVRGQPGPYGVFRFSKASGSVGPIAGRALWTFKGVVPKSIAGTPAWNLVLHHVNASGSAGAVLCRVEAANYGSGDTPGSYTTIVPNALIGVGASGDHNITVLSSTNFDSLVALAASKRLSVQVSRMPDLSSGDSLASHWDLVLPPVLRVDIA